MSPAARAFAGFGLRIRVDSDHPATCPPGWAEVAMPDTVDAHFALVESSDGVELWQEGNLLQTVPGWDDAHDLLELLVTLEATRRSTTHVFLHAGAVTWNGRALLLPGSSGAGKSTLTMALAVRPGTELLSDERVAVDDDLRAWPLPGRLGIKGPDGISSRVSAAALGLSTAGEAVPVGAIALCTYSPGARWAPARLAASRALFLLLPHTSSPRTDATLARLHGLAEVPVFEGRRSDTDEVAAWAEQLW